MLWTHELLLEVLGKDAKQVSGKGRSWQASGVCRRPDILEPGELYIASQEKGEERLRERVPEMFRKGAVAAISAGATPPVQGWCPVYRVPDARLAMARMGEYARKRTEAKIVGVTGSVGKTGVKDALHHVLAQLAPTMSNYRNANCGWGLPESLSNLPEHVTYGIFEMGMLSPGSIAPKSRQVRPHVGLITALAPAHIGFHESMDSIAQTKADIVAGMQPGGVFIVPRDTPWFEILAKKASESPQVERFLTFGTHAEADVRLLNSTVGATHSKVKADIMGRVVDYEVGLGGPHWVTNSLGILAVVAGLDANLDVALGTLPGLVPSFRRGERFRAAIPKTKKVVEVVDDTWNANPTSVEAALAQLKMLKVPKKGRRIVYFGDMLQLGSGAEKMHADLSTPMQEANVDLVHTVGPLSVALRKALPDRMKGKHFADARAAAAEAPSLLQDGDLVLVKASNGINMWRIVHAVVPQRRGARPVPSHWSLAEERAMRGK